MKHYFVKCEQVICGYEEYTTHVTKAKNESKAFKNVAWDQWGETDVIEKGHYEFDNGQIAIRLMEAKEIDKTTYETLTKYFN